MGPIFRPSHFERNQVFIIKEPSKKGAMITSRRFIKPREHKITCPLVWLQSTQLTTTFKGVEFTVD